MFPSIRICAVRLVAQRQRLPRLNSGELALPNMSFVRSDNTIESLETPLRRVLVAIGIAAGIALRVWIIRTPELGYLDSDEAVPG